MKLALVATLVGSAAAFNAKDMDLGKVRMHDICLADSIVFAWRARARSVHVSILTKVPDPLGRMFLVAATESWTLTGIGAAFNVRLASS